MDQLDVFAVRRSKAKTVPALVLVRQFGGDPQAPAFMVQEYRKRLSRQHRTSRPVPHAVINDAALDALYIALRKRRTWLNGAAKVAELVTDHPVISWLKGIVTAPAVGIPRICYRFYLRHWGLRRAVKDSQWHPFLDAAVARFSENGEPDPESSEVWRILLLALLTDLRKATRRRTWASHSWARRRWSFVVLIPEIDRLNGPGPAFLGVFQELAGDRGQSTQPLLVLAACAGTPPDHAVPLGADLSERSAVADKVRTRTMPPTGSGRPYCRPWPRRSPVSSPST
ncbi:hypothetical protein [Streptomyces sp. NPDC005435]|uniref:hypothetical protein n=1 Tax=Streptomyces sp. NPDC005435 TaxID=3154464 RepID=UPI00345369EF